MLYGSGMELSRRTFLKSVAAASSLVVAGDIIGLFEKDTYYMRPGETLHGLYLPRWTKIAMADDCVISSCQFERTQIVIHNAERCLIQDCSLTGSYESGQSAISLSSD